MHHWRSLLCILLAAGIVSCSSPREQRLKWNLKTTVKAYEKIGRHNPQWDAPAKDTLTLYARWRADDANQTEEAAQQIAHRCHDAFAAGCRDPLVLYVHARFVLNNPGHAPGEIADAHRQAAAGLKASRYSSLRKFYGFLRAGEHLYQLKPIPKLDVTEMMNDAAAQLAIAIDGNAAPYGELYQAARAFMQPFHRMEINHDWGWEKLKPALRKKWGTNYAAELSSGQVKID